MNNSRRAIALSSVGASVTVVSVVLTLWWLTAKFLVPSAIVAGYEERAFGALNSLFAGRDTHSVEEYLADWARLARQATLLLSVICVVVLAVSIPTVQRIIDLISPSPRVGLRKTGTELSTWRKLQVFGLASVIVGGHAIAIVLNTEFWPYSNYSMYSTLQGPTFSMNQLVIVDSRGREHVLNEEVHFPPFGIRLPAALNNFRWPIPGDTARLHLAVRAVGSMYQRTRLKGIHSGPKVDRIRLYTYTWLLDPAPKRGEAPDSISLAFDYAVDR